MTPIRIILKEVKESEQPNLESIGALLEHHGYSILVSNMFESDVGDIWLCEIGSNRNRNSISEYAPSLRTAILNALKRLVSHVTKEAARK